MKTYSTKLKGLLLIEPDIFKDERGFFMETYAQKKYQSLGVDVSFIQDNHAKSSKGVLRGMHYQIQFGQAKLVCVSQGEVFDVVVDIRKESETFGQWEGFTLSSENKRQLFIPKGFAHGYCVVSETAEFQYKCSDYYHPEDEGGLIWNDPTVNINWPVKNPIISKKDSNLPELKNISYPVLV